MKFKPHSFGLRTGRLVWRQGFRCYEHVDHGFRSQRFVLGERIIYTIPGRTKVNDYWQGSTTQQWPCQNFKTDFPAAFQWLLLAEDKDNTHDYWDNTESMA